MNKDFYQRSATIGDQTSLSGRRHFKTVDTSITCLPAINCQPTLRCLCETRPGGTRDIRPAIYCRLRGADRRRDNVLRGDEP
jgi:hypothetical protein